MKKLLSLPPNVVDCFHDITGLDRKEWFCTCDPIDRKLGSGGGSAWLLSRCFHDEHETAESSVEETSFNNWLEQEKRILIHAGGQSRRLPAYAPSGKALAPIPIFRWERGQRLSQNLLSLQLPIYEQIMQLAPDSINTMIVSGDVYIRATGQIEPVPADADVVCYGLWLDADVASHHGVFISDRRSPDKLKCMLQKPSLDELNQLQKEHYYLTDIGIWLFSPRALRMLMKRSVNNSGALNQSEAFNYYDLYSDFGCALGTHPTLSDPEVSELKVVVLPLPGGEFYHFGNSDELITSSLALQNIVSDQQRIIHKSRKPHPAMFIQNAVSEVALHSCNQNLWIENSWVGKKWTLAHENIITGVPENNWEVTLQAGDCVDFVPVGNKSWGVRVYGYNDKFAGEEQFRPRFPLTDSLDEAGHLLRHLLSGDDAEGAKLYETSEKLSANDLSQRANLYRMEEQRRRFRALNWPMLAENWQHSVFYQTDLHDAAHEYHAMNLPEPSPLADDAPMLTRIQDAMFRAQLHELRGEDGKEMSDKAFGLLSELLTEQSLQDRQEPRLTVCHDQIVWSRSPVRIDIAGGWTDTPPFCLMEGGNVINLAIKLNGQQPLQTYVKPSKEPVIILRSIDLGATEKIETFEELAQYNKVGSPFSIPKAALALAGFLPRFSRQPYATLRDQLMAFGSGIEVTLLSAIPAGSGLGTSSILASTVLGAINDFCGLGWDKNEIGYRTLVLEQLLTTGGGWQDQFGGILPGVKLLQTQGITNQQPLVRWLPDTLFALPEYKDCHLLYYTGITRTAKNILAQIVRRMFLNQHEELLLLRQMKNHTLQMYDCIQRSQFKEMGQLVRTTWQQNQMLDSGTNPAEVARLTALVDDLCLGYKLPGAGGGGFIYFIAKDPQAAARIKQILLSEQHNTNARFVDMKLCNRGLQVTRS